MGLMMSQLIKIKKKEGRKSWCWLMALMLLHWNSLKTAIKNKAKLYSKWDKKSERQLRRPASQDDPRPGTTRKPFSSPTSALRSAERVVDPITVFSGQTHRQNQSKEKKRQHSKFIGCLSMLFSIVLYYLLSVSSSLLVSISWLPSAFFFSEDMNLY